MKKILAAMIIAVIAVAGVFATNPTTTSLTLNYKVNDLVTRTFTFADAKEGTISYGASFSVGHNGTEKGIVGGSKTFYIVDTSYANIAPAGNAKTMTVTVTVGSSDAAKWASSTYTSTSIVSIGTMGIHEALASTDDTLKYSTVAATNGVKTTYTLGLVDRTTQNAATNWIASIPVSWGSDTVAPAGDYSVALVVGCVAP